MGPRRAPEAVPSRPGKNFGPPSARSARSDSAEGRGGVRPTIRGGGSGRPSADPAAGSRSDPGPRGPAPQRPPPHGKRGRPRGRSSARRPPAPPREEPGDRRRDRRALPRCRGIGVTPGTQSLGAAHRAGAPLRGRRGRPRGMRSGCDGGPGAARVDRPSTRQRSPRPVNGKAAPCRRSPGRWRPGARPRPRSGCARPCPERPPPGSAAGSRRLP